MKPEDEKKMMELHERELVKRLEERYGQPPSAKADYGTQARRSGRRWRHYVARAINSLAQSVFGMGTSGYEARDGSQTA